MEVHQKARYGNFAHYAPLLISFIFVLQAYGVKLDVLKKIANLKANTPKHGSILNYIAHEVYTHSPELLKFSDEWSAVWLAAELSISQIEVEVKQLEKEVEKLRNELKLIPKSRTDIDNSLAGRLEGFLATGEGSLATILSSLKEAHSAISLTLSNFGDKCTANDFGDETDDVVRAFFNLITTFARSFNTASIENETMRREEEKRSEKALRFETSSPSSCPSSKKAEENIFGNFQKSQGQGASADQLISDFKKKLQQKFAASANRRDSFRDSDF